MVFKTFLAAVAIPALASAAALPQSHVEIVGGTTAAAGDFPYIVSLQKSGSHFCGGSLLNANTVLTAAHCAVNQNPASIKVRAGSLSRSSGGTLVGVSSIKVHPQYNSGTTDYDVAIFKLSTSIPASGSVGYATLAADGSDPASGTTTTVAGWGTTTEGGSSLPDALRKVDVPVVARSTCASDYQGALISDRMFCAGLTSGGKDSCQGDSGGPIIDKASKVLIGTVSWGQGCAEANFPGVYARVGNTVLKSFITSNS